MARLRMPGRLSDRHQVKVQLRRAGLHTVCEEARCPNMAECFKGRTATFLILGNRCTRRCGFCAVPKDREPAMPDPEEPRRVAGAVLELGIRHAVVTSVTRDDLPDGGASHFVACLREIRARCPGVTTEFLVPDFGGNEQALEEVLHAQPAVFNHNVETVPRLYPRVRPQASFERSRRVLAKAASRGMLVKSGLMVGLGETDGEVLEVLRLLRETGCQAATIGQYLQPLSDCLPVERIVPDVSFQRFREAGRELGFVSVLAGSLVRSSYRADEVLGDWNSPGSSVHPR